jgi:hypothetical protein
MDGYPRHDTLTSLFAYEWKDTFMKNALIFPNMDRRIAWNFPALKIPKITCHRTIRLWETTYTCKIILRKYLGKQPRKYQAKFMMSMVLKCITEQ